MYPAEGQGLDDVHCNFRWLDLTRQDLRSAEYQDDWDRPELPGQVWVLLTKQGVVPGPEARPLVNGIEDAGIPMKGHQ